MSERVDGLEDFVVGRCNPSHPCRVLRYFVQVGKEVNPARSQCVGFAQINDDGSVLCEVGPVGPQGEQGLPGLQGPAGADGVW